LFKIFPYKTDIQHRNSSLSIRQIRKTTQK
jgi:hypothetical protein